MSESYYYFGVSWYEFKPSKKDRIAVAGEYDIPTDLRTSKEVYEFMNLKKINSCGFALKHKTLAVPAFPTLLCERELKM